jgi:hypothetical protein
VDESRLALASKGRRGRVSEPTCVEQRGSRFYGRLTSSPVLTYGSVSLVLSLFLYLHDSHLMLGIDT